MREEQNGTPKNAYDGMIEKKNRQWEVIAGQTRKASHQPAQQLGGDLQGILAHPPLRIVGIANEAAALPWHWMQFGRPPWWSP